MMSSHFGFILAPPAFSVLAHMYLLACEIPVSMQSFSLLRMSLPSETLGLHSDGRSWDLEAVLCLFSHLSLSCWCHCCPWWTEDRFIGLRFKWLKWLTFKNVYCAKLISDRTTKCSLYFSSPGGNWATLSVTVHCGVCADSIWVTS